MALAVAVVLVAVGTPIALTRGAGKGLGGIAGNSVGRIDPKSGRIVAETAVGNFPGHVAAGDGSTWVTNEGDDSVSQIDPASNAVTDTITSPDIGHDPSGIAVGFGSVWVAESLDGTVARIDLATKKVVASIFVGVGPDRMAVGGDGVWVTDLRDGTLVSIDPNTNRLSKPIPVGRQPTGIAVANDGAIWVTLFSENQVARIDPTSGTETTVNVGNGPNDVAADGSGIWVVNSLGDTVTRIDPSTFQASGLLQTDSGPDAIAVNDEGVWVSNEYGQSVEQFDPSDGQLVRRIPIGNRAEGIAASEDGVFVASRETGQGHRGGRVLAEEPFSPPIDPAGLPPVLAPYIFDGLTAFNRVGGIESDLLVPDLASTLPIPTDGGKTYTFQLRPGIRFSNGDPLEPADVKATFERLFEIPVDLAYWGPLYFTGIIGADRCGASPPTCDLSRGIETNADADTVRFHLTRPDVTFLTKLAAVWIVQAGTPAKMLTKAPVPGTGPYEIQTYEPGNDREGTANDEAGAARMVRNPYFREWSKAAKPGGFPDEIDWRFLIPSSVGARDVEQGTADYAPVDDPAQREKAETFFPSLVHALPVQFTWWVNLNTRSAPFNDPLARKAVAFAIDRAAAGTGRYVGAPACHLIPPGFPGYSPGPCRYSATGDPSGPSDAEKAQRLVTLSGTRGDPVTYNAAGIQGSVPTRYVGSLLTHMGYQVKVVRILNGDSLDERRIDVEWRAFGPDFQFGSSYLGAVCSSDWIMCGKRADAEVKRANNVERSDPAASVPLWTDIDRDIVGQASAIPVYSVGSVLLISSARVHSFQVATNGVIYKDQFWVV